MRLSSSTYSGGLTGPLFGDPAVDAAVDDAAFVRAMLDAEAALALASADIGAVPQEAASAIAATCADLDVDIDALGQASMSVGNPVAPLVRLITAVTTAEAAPWVHHGATSQDIIDTALMLMSKQVGARILERLGVAADVCATLADQHRDTLMVARTLGQQAAPTTFGRKSAGWLTELSEATDRLTVVCRDRLAVQLGGPVGTLAAFGADGHEVVVAYADRLGLGHPTLPWHTDRLRVLDLAAALGGAAAAAGKIATDVLLMAQSEVGEASLAASGGSSSMPHKHNPIDAVLVSAGAARVPGLVATLFAAATSEHERATGAWHSEWQPWRELLSVAGGVVSRVAGLLAGLEIDPTRMRANLDASGGLVMAEHVAARLAGAIGRTAAHDVVAQCAQLASSTGRPFDEVLAADPQVSAHLDREAISAALDPASWLGSAPTMIDRALHDYRAGDIAGRPADSPAVVVTVHPVPPAGLAHTVTGDANAPVVVLGSSLGTTGAMWDPQVPELAKRFRVVTYDHRGHGGSAAPPPPYTIADLGRDVLALLDELGIGQFHYGGLSLGGMVGMWTASEMPARVDRLALLCTSAALDAPEPWHARAATVRDAGIASIADPVVARWFTPGFATAHPDVVDRHRSMLVTSSVEGYAACCEAIAEMDLRDRLPLITAPTLAIAAKQDAAIPPAHSASIVASIPSARLELIDDAAHIASVEQPAVITRLLVEHFEDG